MYVHTCAMVLMWGSGDSWQELVLFFHHVNCGAQTQVVSLDGKFLYPVSLSPAPTVFLLMLPWYSFHFGPIHVISFKNRFLKREHVV